MNRRTNRRAQFTLLIVVAFIVAMAVLGAIYGPEMTWRAVVLALSFAFFIGSTQLVFERDRAAPGAGKRAGAGGGGNRGEGQGEGDGKGRRGRESREKSSRLSGRRRESETRRVRKIARYDSGARSRSLRERADLDARHSQDR